jgi:hypothetical protein
VTQGKLGTRLADWPAAVNAPRWGIAGRSFSRRPGMVRRMRGIGKIRNPNIEIRNKSKIGNRNDKNGTGNHE